MLFKDWQTKSDWDQLFSHSKDGTTFLQAAEGSGKARDRLIVTLSRLLASQNLMVLCGAGTSLDLNPHPANLKGANSLAPSMSDLWNAVRERVDKKEAGLFQKVILYVDYKPDQTQKNVEHLLACCRISEKFKSTPWVSDFLEEAEKAIAQLCNLPKEGTDLSTHRLFLNKLACRPPGTDRLKLFTTNYDLCFETAAAQDSFAVLDGFSPTLPHYFDVSFYDYDWVRREPEGKKPSFHPRLFHLYKIHGSVNWEPTETGVIKHPATERPMLMFPSQGRGEFPPPFMDVMSRFLSELRKPNTGLIIVGFGFQASHLAQPIKQALKHNYDLQVVCANQMFAFEENQEVSGLKQSIEQGNPNLTLLQGSFGDLAESLPDGSHKASASPSPSQENSDLPAAA